MSKKPTSDVRRYLDALFQGKSDESELLIWTLPDKRSHWTKTVADAAKLIAKLEAEKTKNIYCGVSTSPKSFGEYGRCPMNEVAGLSGLWADIDIQGPGHKHQNLPADEETALKLIDRVGLRPSMIVYTGGGLHAYWLFAELWEFESPADRTEAQTLSQAWQRTMQAHAQSMGFTVDGTFDLSRILRVPGTTNRKHEPTPCVIRELNDHRYNPSDFDALLVTGAKEKIASDKQQRLAMSASGLIFDDSRPLPFDKFEALSEAEPRFALSWKRKRTDMKDTSASAWDMSLACFAVAADWSDQEIIDLLVQNRKKHRDDLKRLDYYVRTITAARSTMNRQTAIESLHQLTARTAETAVKESESVDDARRRELLDYISDVLGTRVEKIIRYKQDPPKYRLVTLKGEIELGTVENLIGQVPLRNAIAAADGHFIPKIRTEDWDSLAQALLDVCEHVDTGPEATDVGQMKAWLTRYLDEQIPSELSEQAIANCVPFFKKDEPQRVYIFLAHFREWLNRREGERLSGKAAGIMLKKFGADSSAQSVDKPDGETTTRNVWGFSYWKQLKSTKINGNGEHKQETHSRAAAASSEEQTPF